MVSRPRRRHGGLAIDALSSNQGDDSSAVTYRVTRAAAPSMPLAEVPCRSRGACAHENHRRAGNDDMPPRDRRYAGWHFADDSPTVQADFLQIVRRCPLVHGVETPVVRITEAVARRRGRADDDRHEYR